MKYLIFTLLFTLSSFSQVEVVKISTQRALGKAIGYHVTMKNNSKRAVDAIEWTAVFTDKFGDVKDTKTSEGWSSGNTFTIDTSKEIEPGKEVQVTKGCLVSGATDVKIKITRVHYVSSN